MAPTSNGKRMVAVLSGGNLVMVELPRMASGVM
jgi:hypothetical protein